MLFALLLPVLLLIRPNIAGYVLLDDYNATTFFDMFNFFTDADPTGGAVQFVNQQTAQSSGLISTTNSSVYLGVDSKTVTANRPSLRLQSKNQYNLGLFIADVTHMPGGICGTWPAYWTIGPNWPLDGEIDIIENVNSASSNQMTLHTSNGCSISNTAAGFTGQVKTTNCWTEAPGQGTNVGCGIGATQAATYGTAFNAASGGVYATEWTANGITVWFFPRSQIPSDITSGNPNPSSWAVPQAKFEGSCNFQTAFQNQSIIIDTTFCGQWAGQQAVWSADPVCSKLAATCQDYVMNNPTDFAQAFWQFNSIKVYQANNGFIGSQTIPASAAPSTQASAVPSTQSVTTTFVTLTKSISNSSSTVTLPATPSTSTAYVDKTTTVVASQPSTATNGQANLSPISIQATKSSHNGYIDSNGDGHAIGDHTSDAETKSTMQASVSVTPAGGYIGQRR